MTERTRIISAITAITVVFVLLFSILYIAVEADHDCTGENCPICEQIAICQQRLKQVSGGTAVIAFGLFVFFTLCVVQSNYTHIHTCRNACRLNDCCGGYYIILNVFGDRRIREMRKIISIIISVSVVLCIAGCSQSSENKEEQTGAKQENTSALAQNNDGIDLDLTELSSTMVYSEVYNMMEAPEKYIGKTVKMAGNFAVYQDAENNKNYYACLISDATACCAQGIEFEWKGEHTFPDDYPNENAEISVIGVFETYEENGYSYCRLKDAELTF